MNESWLVPPTPPSDLNASEPRRIVARDFPTVSGHSATVAHVCIRIRHQARYLAVAICFASLSHSGFTANILDLTAGSPAHGEAGAQLERGRGGRRRLLARRGRGVDEPQRGGGRLPGPGLLTTVQKQVDKKRTAPAKKQIYCRCLVMLLNCSQVSTCISRRSSGSLRATFALQGPPLERLVH